MKLYHILEQQLKKEKKYTDNGELKKWVVIDKARNFDEELIGLLLENETLKEKFFVKVKDVLVFKQNLFIDFLEQKNYLNDSYTRYKNKVGLTIDGKYLKQRNEVALVWPFKDCILEGGQSREEQKREEIFFNEILAQDEITQLLEPKVLTNSKVYDKEGEHPLKGFTRDAEINRKRGLPEDTITDNLIIKGNNLLALHTLQKEFAGKVKLIYIDPPYNTGNDGFKYNDSFNHSTWLTFMKNRLEVAKQLLKDDGVIFVQCDDNEQAYLKVLMDEVFGRENFVNLVTVKTKIAGVSGSSEGGSLQDNCEYLNIYSKQRSNFKIENNLFDKIELNTFIKEYKNNSKSWKYTTVLEYCDKGEYLKSIKAGNGEEIKIFVHKKYSFKSINQIAKEKYKNNLEDAFYGEINNVFRTTNAQSSIRTRVMDLGLKDELISIEYEPTKGKNKGKTVKLYFKDEIRNLITFLSDVVSIEDNRIYKLEKKGTLWDTINYNNLTKDGLVEFQNGKKPEELLRMVIELCTQRNAIVLDYHLGSGTTAAVAHKMGRQYIGIEQMDYIETIAVERLKKVIEGEQGGISKSVNWQGGGSFVYLELKKYNETYIEQIEEAKDTETLLQIWEQMKAKSFLNYNVDIKKQDEHIEEFKKLSLKEQKQHLCEILDKNQLYVNLSSLNDADFECTEEEKRVTKDFYKLSASRINQM